MIRPPYYSDEKNAQILLALLKAHGIKKIIASPGTTNIAFVGSAQHDPFFEMYSAVDERHAAYMACGLATESKEPVVLSCTGATASRNYFPALTEAHYRHLPILAVTSMQVFSHSGHLYPQWIERGTYPADTVKMSVACPSVNTSEEIRVCSLNINKAILELTRHGGGPVHINLETINGGDFHATSLPVVQKISRYFPWDERWPELAKGKIVVWITSHKPMSDRLTKSIEDFAGRHDCVVLIDATSSYRGKYAVCASILAAQSIRKNPKYESLVPNLVIHIGGVTGDYPTRDFLHRLAPVWRVSEDGDVVDSLDSLENVFEMPEQAFFDHYNDNADDRNLSFYGCWKDAVHQIVEQIPEMSYSNLWIAKTFGAVVPEGSVVHAAILSSLRSINFTCDINRIVTMSNVGGFGIDGCLSTLLGASLSDQSKLHFIMIGDMAFFYDMNALGNRHVGKNIRVLLIRNGISGEMYMPISAGAKLGEAAREYVCSDRHFGNKSKELVKNFVESLGFKYCKAETKQEMKSLLPSFVAADSDCPIVLECFTEPQDERDDLDAIMHIDRFVPKKTLMGRAKDAMPTRFKNAIKSVMQ